MPPSLRMEEEFVIDNIVRLLSLITDSHQQYVQERVETGETLTF